MLRICKFNIARQSEKYFYSQLMLCLPWYYEHELQGMSATYKEQYQIVKNIFDHNTQLFNQINKQLDKVLNNLLSIVGFLKHHGKQK